MIRTFQILVVALLVNLAYADDVDDVLRLWGAQGGPWIGHIDIYGPDSPEPQTVGLVTKWDAASDSSIVTKIETFRGPDTEISAVTLMLADEEEGGILTPYFANGRQRDYRFAVDTVSLIDDTHWTIVVATPGGQEAYEGRPARLRYVRTRNGDTIENTKEVRFLDGVSAGSSDAQNVEGGYELRSFIRQTLSSESN